MKAKLLVSKERLSFICPYERKEIVIAKWPDTKKRRRRTPTINRINDVTSLF